MTRIVHTPTKIQPGAADIRQGALATDASVSGASPAETAVDGFAGRVAGTPGWRPLPPPRAPARRVIGPQELSEEAEDALLQKTGGSLTLLPYLSFDPGRSPVVLIHGFDGDPEDFTDLATRLQNEGHQVFVAFYDDTGRLTHENGEDLARALLALRRDYYTDQTRLTIVAHSMGGLVTRCALNQLQDPNWLTPSAQSATPRAGFASVRLRTIDTPWDGFMTLPSFIRNTFVEDGLVLIAGLFGYRGASEMAVANGEMFENLYKVTLPGVDIQNIAARQIGPRDNIRSIDDLDDKELTGLVHAITQGIEPVEPRLRNLARSLAQDSRYPELQSRARAAVADGMLVGNIRHLVDIYSAVMPVVIGSHDGVVLADPTRSDGVLDRLSRELKDSRQ